MKTRTTFAAIAVGAAIAAAVPIGVALAADSRLDLADDHIEKAIVLVEASKNPNAKDPDRPFGNHDARAVRLLEAARAEIAAAEELGHRGRRADAVRRRRRPGLRAGRGRLARFCGRPRRSGPRPVLRARPLQRRSRAPVARCGEFERRSHA